MLEPCAVKVASTVLRGESFQQWGSPTLLNTNRIPQAV
jgi:hypothetical protein